MGESCLSIPAKLERSLDQGAFDGPLSKRRLEQNSAKLEDDDSLKGIVEVTLRSSS